MPDRIQTRLQNELSLLQPDSPMRALELDDDSFSLAYGPSSDVFLQYALSTYASNYVDEISTVYSYCTDSVNFSRGEEHRMTGSHLATFFGVVGRMEVLKTIQLALIEGTAVPDNVIESETDDKSKIEQISCRNAEYVSFKLHQASYHLQDGYLWRPYEPGVWFTAKQWRT